MILHPLTAKLAKQTANDANRRKVLDVIVNHAESGLFSCIVDVESFLGDDLSLFVTELEKKGFRTVSLRHKLMIRWS